MGNIKRRLERLEGSAGGCSTCAANPIEIVWVDRDTPRNYEPCRECGTEPVIIDWTTGDRPATEAG